MRPIGVNEIIDRRVPERPTVCAHCGKTFTQYKLSEKFLTNARAGETHNSGYYAIDRLCPDSWVPCYCPTCERKELAAPSLSVPKHATPQMDLAYEADERAALRSA